MSKDVNEDLIEATIRRVAEAKAAQQAAGARMDDGDGDGPTETFEDSEGAREVPPPASVDEDLIEATIRRVTAAKAAHAAAAEVLDDTDIAPEQSDAPTAAAADVDEDMIEATIRRVQANQAARDAEQHATSDDAQTHADEDDAASAAFEEAIAVAENAVIAEEIQAPEPAVPARTTSAAEGSTPAEWIAFAQRIERRLDETHASVEAVIARLTALASMVERISAAGSAPLQPHSPAAPVAQEDDDWDEDAPLIPKMPVGIPPRPAILRDPSPLTATAAQLEEAPAAEVTLTEERPVRATDDRPLPRPLPPLHVDQRRGLDLLPRSYRITVEDKRRGVDLVPLHRALLGMDGVKDMSLLSYNNGVAMVSLETVADIDAESLGRAVSRAMSRDAQVEVHNENTMVVKLGDE